MRCRAVYPGDLESTAKTLFRKVMVLSYREAVSFAPGLQFIVFCVLYYHVLQTLRRSTIFLALIDFIVGTMSHWKNFGLLC